MSAPVPWPIETEEKAVQLWSEGHSATMIAVAIDRSRNAVIGKLNRIGVIPSGRTTLVRVYTPRAPKPPREKPRRPIGRPRLAPSLKAARKRIKRVVRPAMPLPDKDAQRTDLISLMELNGKTCRWPIGHPKTPGFGFCGHGVRDGFVYCPEHCERAFQFMEVR